MSKARKSARAAPAAASRAPSGDPSTRRTSPVLRLVKWALVAGIWGFVAALILLAWFAWDLPETGRLAPNAAQAYRPSVALLADDGRPIARYGHLYGSRLLPEEIPPQLAQAVVAIEDRRFYEHPGLDWRGLARAMLVNLREGRIAQGGSTLTQQLAKNLFLTPERSIERKVKELLLALWLERRFTKQELLSIYLNRVYFGAGTYGVAAAAERYFGKPVDKIDIYEAALLAGLLRAPSRLSPLYNKDAADTRARVVLSAMYEAGFLSAEETAELKTHRVQLAKTPAGKQPVGGQGRRYFADWVIERVGGFAGEGASDLTVMTSLDPRLQALAEKVVGEAPVGGAQAALVAMTHDGAVRAMVGGRDYRKTQFNRVTQALRQPGSAFKPIVYLPALEAGMNPDTKVLDEPITVEGWSPQNFSREFRGTVTLREAVARSLNTTAVRVSEDVGRKRVLQAARRLGITAPLTEHPSLALGTGEVTLLELTAAYATFANGGMAVTPFGVTEIRSGRDVVYRPHPPNARAIKREDARAMTDLLRAVVAWGTGRNAAFDEEAAGKSGTSQGSRDAWFLGYTDRLVVGVWIGNDDGRPLQRTGGGLMTGGREPALLWRAFMEGAYKGRLPGPVDSRRNRSWGTRDKVDPTFRNEIPG